MLKNPLRKGPQMPKACLTLCPAATKAPDHAGLPHKWRWQWVCS